MFQRRRHGKVDFNRYLSRGNIPLRVRGKISLKKSWQSPASDYNVGVNGASTAVSLEVRHLLNSHFRDWVDYKDGFGDFKLWNDEFWLGNEHIHSLISEGQQLFKSTRRYNKLKYNGI